jgi:hypothetical protein
LLQILAQEIEKGIDEAVTQARMTAEAICLEGGPHGEGMQAELAGNGADLPMLGVKQMTDLRDLFFGNHVLTSEKGLIQRPRQPQI